MDVISEKALNEEVEDTLLVQLYSSHHKNGGRLRQSFMEEKRARLFSSWIGTDKDVLDLGCRDGTLTRHFAPKNNVIGCDIDKEALAYAENAYGIKTKQVNLNCSLPFKSGSFDIVILAETIEHLPYPKLTLLEIKRVLRNNGLFIGNAPIAYHIKNRFRVIRGKMLDYDPTHCQYFSYSSLMKLLGTYFNISEISILKGEKWAWLSTGLFARNVAFKLVKVTDK